MIFQANLYLDKKNIAIERQNICQIKNICVQYGQLSWINAAKAALYFSTKT